MQENNLSENLQYLLHKHSVDIMNLAAALSESPEAIAKFKSGSLKNPSLNMTVKLAKYFDLSLDQFVFENLAVKG